MNLSQLLRSASILCVASFAPRAAAQCSEWTDGFGLPGIEGMPHAAIVFDDGSGPALYVGGNFDVAGDVPARNLARWDGGAWSEVGGGVDTAYFSEVRAFAVHDDGSGPALYVGGSFVSVGAGTPAVGIAKWNGASWSALGSGVGGGAVDSLFSFDDGSGSKLYAGGSFTSAGGNPASLIAAWDGSAWSSVGGGLSSTMLSPTVLALAAYDEGAGPRLFAGGAFNRAEGSIAVTSIARWNGSSWSAVNSQTFAGSASIRALLAFDDGSGPALYAGGSIQQISGVPGIAPGVARWNGSTWSHVGNSNFAPSPGDATALIVFDHGNGPRLVAPCVNTGPVGRLSEWNGASWSYISDALTPGSPYAALVEDLCAFDEGAGPALFALGNLGAAAGAPLTRIARLAGSAWSAVGPGAGVADEVLALCSTPAGPDGGPALYAGGAFLGAGDVGANHVARWDGSNWHALGAGVSVTSVQYEDVDVRALLVHDDGSGPVLYAGGNFRDAGGTLVNNIARWNGTSWSALGSGLNGAVSALAVYDDGSGEALYAGGLFTASGATAMQNIAKWNGVAWQPLGAGVSGGPSVVKAFVLHDDGSGPCLYVGGGFTQAGSTPASRVARWNGTSWSAVGNGVDAMVNSLAVFGGELYVGGQFVHADGLAVYNIARWNGAAWSALGAGFDNFVLALHVYDDGSGGGSALFAAGRFEHAGALAIERVAKWNGSSWSSAGGPDAAVKTLATFDDAFSPWPELYAGGRFDNAGGQRSLAIARYANPCACQATSYCTAGTTSNGCVPTISGIGAASATATSGFTIRIDDVEGQKQGHIAYSITGANANPWSPLSSSFLCIKAPTQRTPTQNSNGTNGACDGVMSIDWNDYIATHPGALGTPLVVGTQVWAQLYFRDPPAPKTTNLSDGLTFTVCP